MEMVARFAMRGMKAAVSMVCIFFLLGLFLRPFLLISSALVALVTLRDGPVRGIKVVTCSLLLFLAVSYTLPSRGSTAMFLPILLWLPMILVALPLRQTQNYNLSLLLCGVVVFLCSAYLRVSVQDLPEFWIEKMRIFIDIITQQAQVEFDPFIVDPTVEQLQYLSGQVHIWWLILIQSCLLGTLFLARWWQSRLYYPEGFGSEFRRIQFAKNLVVILGLLAVINLLERSITVGFSLSADILAILIVLFATQGLAVVHHRGFAVKASAGWFIGLYTFLVLVPQLTGLTLAVTGIADSIVDFRRLRVNSSSNQKS